MAEISRTTLIGKLNDVSEHGLREGTVFCRDRGHPTVEMVHWIHAIYNIQDTDVHHIFRFFGVDEAHFVEDLIRTLARLPGGATSVSGISPAIDLATKNGWIWASLHFNQGRVRTGHLVIGLLKDPSVSQSLQSISAEVSKIDTDALIGQFDEITSASVEVGLSVPTEDLATDAVGKATSSKALDQFTVDWTAMAAAGEMDPIVGRDNEIRQMVDILMRRRQNNPILIGEAGVGKTAVVEGFAQRIARGDVPPPLQGVAVRYLDIGLMQAGASMKGEFEKRLRQVIDEVQGSTTPIILFIDEAHTLIGAGGSEGVGDAANLLKPALARGTLRTIAATTWSEYKKYIEKDPALTRRFQVVQVAEPENNRAIKMLRGVANVMEQHHNVVILNEAVTSAVELSARYIPARQLPDKAVSLLDTACARVGVSQHAVPGELDDVIKRIEALELEVSIADRETELGVGDDSHRAHVVEQLDEAIHRRSNLEAKWETEKGIVTDLLTIQNELIGSAEDADKAGRQQQLAALREELRTVQGDEPLILPLVDQNAVASVVADWTGIPVGGMVKDEAQAVLNLADTLGQRVVGQSHAHEAIVRRLKTARAGLDNPNKPVGVFMLAGPSGVGKTETAIALAESMYGGEQNLITINMSEFQEAHTVSTLKGAPPGYVGYGEGGVLTEAVRRRPYSVVLLDEVEKAHSDVHEIFFQVFDKGVMDDGEGREIDFRNTLIILTTNVGSDLVMAMCADVELMPNVDQLTKALRKPMLDVFPAALLGRIVTIPFFPLSDEMIHAIAKLQLDRIVKRVSGARDVSLSYSDNVISLIAERCTELESGGRVIDNILTNGVLPRLSEEFLQRMLAGDTITSVAMGVESGEFTFEFH